MEEVQGLPRRTAERSWLNDLRAARFPVVSHVSKGSFYSMPSLSPVAHRISVADGFSSAAEQDNALYAVRRVWVGRDRRQWE